MIFAAGLGTRLRPLTDTMPKALVAVGGVAMLERTARRLVEAGVTRLVVNVCPFADAIEAFLRSRGDFGVDVRISHESPAPRISASSASGSSPAARSVSGQNSITRPENACARIVARIPRSACPSAPWMSSLAKFTVTPRRRASSSSDTSGTRIAGRASGAATVRGSPPSQA